jgi:hypothetical protein
VTSWDGFPLRYYGSSTGSGVDNTAGLLYRRDGQCGAFANLLMDAFYVNGVGDAKFTEIKPISPLKGFAIKNIAFQSASHTNDPPWNYDQIDLVTAINGIPGQNMNPPLVKLFGNHWIVHRGMGIYYDPSYGIMAPVEANFPGQVAAWKRDDGRWAQGSEWAGHASYTDSQ